MLSLCALNNNWHRLEQYHLLLFSLMKLSRERGGGLGTKVKCRLNPQRGTKGRRDRGVLWIQQSQINDNTASFTYNINKTNSWWVYFITLTTTQIQNKVYAMKGQPSLPLIIPERNCSIYLMSVAKFNFDAHPGARHFWRALASTAEKWREK